MENYHFRDLAKMMPPFCARCPMVDVLLVGGQGIGQNRTALLGALLRYCRNMHQHAYTHK